MKKRRCTALRADGAPCRAWAVRASQTESDGPALCAAHGGLARRGLAPIVMEARREGRLYDAFFSDEEFLALEALAEEQSLESEVRLVRVALRRLLEDFGREYGLRGVELERRALTLYKGAETL